MKLLTIGGIILALVILARIFLLKVFGWSLEQTLIDIIFGRRRRG